MLVAEGRFRSMWNVALAFLICYTAVSVPIEIAFERDLIISFCRAAGATVEHPTSCVSWGVWVCVNFAGMPCHLPPLDPACRLYPDPRPPSLHASRRGSSHASAPHPPNLTCLVPASCLRLDRVLGPRLPVDLFFIIDVLINLRTGYTVEGHFVDDDYEAAAHYLHPATGSFITDFLGSFPLNLILWAAGTAGTTQPSRPPYRLTLSSHPSAVGTADPFQLSQSSDASGSADPGRVNRMLRLLRLTKLFKLARLSKLATYLEYLTILIKVHRRHAHVTCHMPYAACAWHMPRATHHTPSAHATCTCHMHMSHAQVNPALLRIVRLSLISILCCHWFGCLWWLISDLELSHDLRLPDPWQQENNWQPPAWVRHHPTFDVKCAPTHRAPPRRVMFSVS